MPERYHYFELLMWLCRSVKTRLSRIQFSIKLYVMIALAVLWRELPSQRSYSDKGAYLDVGVWAFKLSGTKLALWKTYFYFHTHRTKKLSFSSMAVMSSCVKCGGEGIHHLKCLNGSIFCPMVQSSGEKTVMQVGIHSSN